MASFSNIFSRLSLKAYTLILILHKIFARWFGDGQDLWLTNVSNKDT